MHEPTTSAVLIALGVTLAAGLATALGSLLVIFARGPNPRLLASAWPSPVARWSTYR